jgi:hypothetical protein
VNNFHCTYRYVFFINHCDFSTDNFFISLIILYCFLVWNTLKRHCFFSNLMLYIFTESFSSFLRTSMLLSPYDTAHIIWKCFVSYLCASSILFPPRNEHLINTLELLVNTISLKQNACIILELPVLGIFKI